MKKLTAAILILCILFSFAGCAKAELDEPLPNLTIEENILQQQQTQQPTQQPIEQNKPTNDKEEKPSSPTLDTKVDFDVGGSVVSTESGCIIETNTNISQSVTNDNGFIPDVIQPSESYTQITENKFIKTSENNLSTFAADVDTASYTRIRRYLSESGIDSVPADLVRIEEMINYFSYDYKEPEDDKPFAVQSEIFDCPWNNESKLIKIGLSTKKADMSKLTGSNLVFLIDVSGSMNAADKLPLVQKAFSMLGENLTADDRISIVTYASSDQVVLDGVFGNEQIKIQNAIENLRAGGGTYGSKGIITAYELAEKYFIEGGNNRVILATDGDLNIGLTTESELKELITKKKESGVYLSVMGFGTGNLNDKNLEALADNGNGNYAYIDNQLEARRALITDMGGTLFTVAKDVKLQAEFNKDAVSEYRLIGYENRVMASEDFNDDKKDGGEIGAGHRVTVLYEVKVSDTNAEKWLTLNIRHKKPDGNTSELNTYDVGKNNYTDKPSEDSVFATAVAQFGMLIRKSENVTGSFEEVYNRIKDLECVKADPYKKEFLGFVQKAK